MISKNREVIVVGDGAAMQFDRTLAFPFIVPGTVRIECPPDGELLDHKGNGQFWNKKYGSAVIDYRSGYIGVTLLRALACKDEITVSYDHDLLPEGVPMSVSCILIPENTNVSGDLKSKCVVLSGGRLLVGPHPVIDKIQDGCREFMRSSNNG
jgi:hypothetical protein